MFWTLELASYLEDAPWPATKDELIDYAIRSGAPIEVIENLQDWKTKERSMKVLTTSGPIIRVRTTSSLMKTNTKSLLLH